MSGRRLLYFSSLVLLATNVLCFPIFSSRWAVPIANDPQQVFIDGAFSVSSSPSEQYIGDIGVVNGSNTLTVYDAHSGVTISQMPLPGLGSSGRPVFLSESEAIVTYEMNLDSCGGGGVLRVNFIASKVVWSVSSGGCFPTPVIVGDQLIVSSGSSPTINALDLLSGATLWTSTVSGGSAYMQYALYGDLLIFEQDFTGIRAVSVSKNGATVWGPVGSTGTWRATPTVDVKTGLLYVGCGGGYANDWNDCTMLYCVNSSTGAIVWNVTLDGILPYGPDLRHGLVLIGTGAGSVFALNQTTGKIVWKFTQAVPVTTSVRYASGVVLVGTNAGQILALDWFSGSLIQTLQVTSKGNKLFGNLLTTEGEKDFYFSADNNMLYAMSVL